MIEGPIQEGEHWVWKTGREGVEVRFTGRGPAGSREEILRRVAPEAPPISWPRQVHSARVLPAAAGECGEGDALFSDGAGLTLCVVTADCVPIVLAGPSGLAAVHAGWRGIAGRIVAATLERISHDRQTLAGWTAWIGPAIGQCCYEVGDEVAEAVVAASHPGVAVTGPAGKPHLDLQEAVRHQLAEGGVGEVEAVRACTRCATERLYSYRREGKGAGRNLSLIWRG
ncbi:MAG TPA: peptidoglycan editing factor PgeF [Thermoanaerobaculia bacterium]|nr:peptidoglycan editing factor PgeF [Thermoanaerobaculia bacterium]